MVAMASSSTSSTSDNPPISVTGDNLAITVVVPTPEIPVQQVGQMPFVPPTQVPVIEQVYPVHVWESRENGRREIIRVYELTGNETPSQIPRESFERDGFRFELAEIVRREIPAHSTLDHVETIELSTQTNDLETIIRLLSPTMEHLQDDGYFGVLALDISSIQIVSQGTSSSNFTATRTREFPHLSNTDTSLVPRTITENGRTYNLSNVEWRNQTSNPVDFRDVASSFTAVATYTRVGTRTATIGYTTTAEYRGQLSRIAVGRTEFTAHFIGIPIVLPTVTEVQDQATDSVTTELGQPAITPAIENVTVEQVHIGGIVIEKEQPLIPNEPVISDELVSFEPGAVEPLRLNPVLVGILFVGGMVSAYFLGKHGKAAAIRFLDRFKKTACVLLACGLTLGSLQTAYAVTLPPYGFGSRNVEATVHMDTQLRGFSGYTVTSGNMELVHFNPNWAGTQSSGHAHGNATHFAPSRASPLTTTPAGYIYGEYIGVLTVDRTGRQINVIAGATMEAMDFGAGHFSFTGLNTGNTALIGHNRGRQNGFFEFVRHLQAGDILTLEVGGISRRYAVSMEHIIDYTDFSLLSQFGDDRLTLVTCVEYQRNNRRVAVALAID